MRPTEADSSAAPGLFGGAVEDVLFGTGPIEGVQSLLGLGHEETFRWIALLGDTWGIMLALGVALWLYGRKTVYFLLGAVTLGALSKALMSVLFGVPRPSGEEIVVYQQVQISSFPSGHVYQILIPWGLLYVRERLSLLVPVLMVLIVSVTRLYLGVHYLADILFGILFGILFVWGYVHLFPRVAGWFYQRSVGFYAAATGVAGAIVLTSIYTLVDTARRWEILGIVLGAGVALIVEHRAVRYRPPVRRQWQVGALGIGLVGLLFFAFVGMQLEAAWRMAHLGLAFAIVLWTLLMVPALIQHARPG